MSTVNKFEDLKVWQKAREINLIIYAVTNKGSFSKDFGMRDQIRRASISILSNIAEGFERNGTKEFKQFLSFAKASAGEVRSQLYVAKDLEYISNEEFVKAFDKISEVSKMISGLINYLKTTEIKGSKFMEEAFEYGGNHL